MLDSILLVSIKCSVKEGRNFINRVKPFETVVKKSAIDTFRNNERIKKQAFKFFNKKDYRPDKIRLLSLTKLKTL